MKVNKSIIYKRKCEICEKNIDTKIETQYNGKESGTGTVRREILFSNDGVMFSRKWFCNECWELIIKGETK